MNALQVPGDAGGLDPGSIPGDETQNGEKTADGTAVIDEPSKNVISGQVSCIYDICMPMNSYFCWGLAIILHECQFYSTEKQILNF